MHAKRAPYPSRRSAGVYLQLGGNEDRHGVCTSATRLSPSLCSHLCAVKFKLLEVSENPPCPLPHTDTHTLLFSLHSSPTAHGSDRQDDPGVRDPDQSHSLISLQGGINHTEDAGSNNNYTHSPSLPIPPSAPPTPTMGEGGLRGGQTSLPCTRLLSQHQGGGGSSRPNKSAKVTVVYLGSNKHRSLVNTSLPNSARSAFFHPPTPPPVVRVFIFPCLSVCTTGKWISSGGFCSGGCDLVWVIFMPRVLSVVIKYKLPTTNTPWVRLIQWKPGRKPCSCFIYAAFVSSVLNIRATGILLHTTKVKRWERYTKTEMKAGVKRSYHFEWRRKSIWPHSC